MLLSTGGGGGGGGGSGVYRDKYSSLLKDISMVSSKTGPVIATHAALFPGFPPTGSVV